MIAQVTTHKRIDNQSLGHPATLGLLVEDYLSRVSVAGTPLPQPFDE